jgi:hypothetical protein
VVAFELVKVAGMGGNAQKRPLQSLLYNDISPKHKERARGEFDVVEASELHASNATRHTHVSAKDSRHLAECQGVVVHAHWQCLSGCWGNVLLTPVWRFLTL